MMSIEIVNAFLSNYYFKLYRQIKPYIYVLLGTVNKPATFVQHSGLFAYNH